MKSSKKYFKNITGVQEIRDLLGFTQSEFAQILMISRAQVAMAEINKRNLPDEAGKRFTEITLALLSIKEELAPLNLVTQQIDKETLFNSLNYKWKSNDMSIRRVEEKLKRIEIDRDRLQKIRKGIKYFSGRDHIPDTYMVLRMKQECTKIEASVSEIVKVNLEKRLFMLQTEKVYLDKQLSDIGEKGTL